MWVYEGRLTLQAGAKSRDCDALVTHFLRWLCFFFAGIYVIFVESVATRGRLASVLCSDEVGNVGRLHQSRVSGCTV